MKDLIKKFSKRPSMKKSFRKFILAKRQYRFFRRLFRFREFYYTREMFPSYKYYHLAPLWLMNTFIYRQSNRHTFFMFQSLHVLKFLICYLKKVTFTSLKKRLFFFNI